MNTIKRDFTQVEKLFAEEFGLLRIKFAIFDLTLSEATDSKEPYVANPGVYVFWHPNRGVIKVGRHFTNSRKRALEHVQENINTGGTMAVLKHDQEARLFLFNLKEIKDKHWAAALEIYFELSLSPDIKSARLG